MKLIYFRCSLWLLVALLPAFVIAQPMANHGPNGVPQEAILQSKLLACGDLVFSLQVINNGSGCCYRLKVNNSNPDNCFMNIGLTLNAGEFTNFTHLSGWQHNTGGPADYTVRPAIGFVPLGNSSIAEFCIDGASTATLTLLWNDLCVLEGCAAEFDVNGCFDPGNARITGVKYRECGNLPYVNQTPISGWTIQLLDSMQNVLGEQVTQADGSYTFFDLHAGTYTVKEIQQPGWTPSQPASGQTTITLAASQERFANFGNCPPQPIPCDCPAGTQPGGNAVANGNFSGSGGFASGYALNNNNPPLQAGQYWIGSNPASINAGFAACGDHTSGSGNMMVVNGVSNQSTNIWSQTFTMTPNTSYKFEAWVASLSATSPAQLSVFFNFGNVSYEVQRVFAPVTTCTWERICAPWTNGPNPTTVTISLVNQNAATTGNDFALDDISFRRCVIPHGTITGRVYETCDSMSYSDQPILSGWTVQLRDSLDNLISEQVTDTSGAYSFADLPPGNYICRTALQPGWTTNIPASGQIAFELNAGGTVVQNFGECLTCTTCPPPTNLQLTALGPTSAHLSWTASDCSDREWTYVDDKLWLHTPPGVTEVVLNDLVPGIPHIVHMVSSCSDSSMSIHSDTILFNYPCYGGYTYCPNTLIINGTFEQGTAGLPTAADQINQSTGWQAANSGSISSVGDWYSQSNGLWNGLYNDVANQQYTYFYASCGLRYAGFDLNTCEGITTPLTASVAPGTGYDIGFWWSPKEPVTSNFTFLAILSGANCSVNTANGGTACTHQCNGDFHVPVTATPLNVPGHWYFHSFSGNAPVSFNQLTFAANSSGPIVNNYIYIDEVCLSTVSGPCYAGPRITHNPDHPNAFLGEADLGAGSTLVSAVWDFGDGTKDSSCCLGSVIHDFAPGTYEVCLTVTAADSSGATCSNSRCISVVITAASGKCDEIAAFLQSSGFGDCCYRLVTSNTAVNCFTEIDLTLSSGNFANAQPTGSMSFTSNGNTGTLTPNPPGFIPTGNDLPIIICDPMGTDPYTVDVDFVYAGGVCHQSFGLSCDPALCVCQGFQNISFYNILNHADIPVDCNQPSVLLPCIGSDAYYSLQGNLSCQGNCVPSINYEIFPLNGPSLGTGTFPGSSFQLTGIKYPPGFYQIVLTGMCGASTCTCTINFEIPSCTVPCQAAFTITPLDNCGLVQLTGTSTGTGPIGYQWYNSVSTPNQVVQLACGPNNICVSVTCADGSMSSICKTYVVSDPILPTAVCKPGVAVDLGTSCAFQVTPGFVDGGSSDNCPNFTLSVSPAVLASCTTNLVTLTVTDWCNNTSTCTMGIQTGESDPPVITCPQSQTVGTDLGKCFYTFNSPLPTASDNCDPNPMLTCTWEDPNGTIQPLSVPVQMPKGASTIRCLATDNCGNESLPCIYKITVQDQEPPMLICPQSLTVQGIIQPPNACQAVVSGIGPIVSDNCPVLNVDYSIAPSGNTGMTDASGETFPQGISTVSYLLTDCGGNTKTCSFTVTVTCPPPGCACGMFSDLFARPTAGAQSIPLTCGSQPVAFGCPNPGFSIPITGKFECVGSACTAVSQINWTLTGPVGPFSGTVQAGPYFYLPILPYQYGKPGTYTLTLTGNCGGQPCPPCVLQFTVNCPDPCPCDQAQLQADVKKGFASILYSNSCKGCFSPIALNDCDMVQWSVDGGPVVGMTNSNGTFCYTFSGSGTHIVTMTVIRKKSDGTVCGQASVSLPVTITCNILVDCGNGPFVANPRMSEGALSGGLNSGGASAGWIGLAGNPVVKAGTPGSLDGWSIDIGGKLDSSDVLSQLMPVCLKKDTGMLSFRFTRPLNATHISFGCNLSVQLFRGNTFVLEYPTWNPIRCLKLASIELAPLDTGWVDVQVPFDVSSWNVVDTCGDAPYGVFVRPVIYVNNALSSDQGGSSTRSSIQIDNFCLDGTLVGIQELPSSKQLRIFPNPNAGSFSVELPAPAAPGMSFRIVGLTGQRLREQETQAGAALQTVYASDLPAGLYFLQVLSEGKVLAVEKFVKQ